MTLLVKDANTATQSISTQTDAQGNLTPVNVPAAIANNMAVPVSTTAPLPVMSTAAVAASDGSGTIVSTAVSQSLFGGVVPVNGYMIQNNSSSNNMYVNDVGAATNTAGASFVIAKGTIFMTPSGYKPPGPVQITGTSADAFVARRW